MKNPADLLEVCKTILRYQEKGDPAKDVIEQTSYSEDELLHELCLFYVSKEGV